MANDNVEDVEEAYENPDPAQSGLVHTCVAQRMENPGAQGGTSQGLVEKGAKMMGMDNPALKTLDSLGINPMMALGGVGTCLNALGAAGPVQVAGGGGLLTNTLAGTAPNIVAAYTPQGMETGPAAVPRGPAAALAMPSARVGATPGMPGPGMSFGNT